MTTLILLSGGMDSALCLAQATRAGYNTAALFVNYGQRARKHEYAAARRLARYYNTPLYTAKVYPPLRGSSLTGTRGTLEGPDTVVPARNLILASMATNLAVASQTIRTIQIGCNADDASTFPDCRPAFWYRFNTTKNAAELPVELLTPLIMLPKRSILRMCNELAVPIHLTRSCYSANPKPCGECGACRLIAVSS